MTLHDPVAALRNGDLVVVLDDDAPDGGAELWLAAEGAAAAAFARLVRYSSGFVTVAVPAVRAATLGLPAMIGAEATFGHAAPVQAITCDAAEGITTGISAADRARTARLLADAHATPEDFTRPGHLVPLRIREGVTDATAPAAAALEMCALAGLRPAMIRCELVVPSGALARPVEGLAFAHDHGLAVLSVRELAAPRTVPLSA
jgi:3,4-dihydroxy-2-butanone 4-phosphate synthase